MARKKITRTEETILDNPPDADGDEGENDTEVAQQPSPEDLEQLDVVEYLLSLGGDDGARYRVDRLPTKPGERQAFCNNYSREALSLDAIRETFGGGTYRITAYGQGSRYVGSRTVTIADLPKSAQPAQNPLGGLDLTALARELRGGGGPDNSMTMMTEMMRQNSELLRAIITRPEPKQSGPTTLEILQMIREMNSVAPKSNEGSAVELLLKGIELGKEFSGSGGGEDSMLGLAGKGIEMLKPLIERGATPAAPAAPAAPRPALAAPAVQPAVQSTTENDPMIRQLNWLRTQTQALCVQASRGKSPELYAEVLLDNLPSFISVDDLLMRLKEPNAVAQLAQLNSDVAKYAPWFEELRKYVIEFLSPEDTDMPAVPAGGIDVPGDTEGEGTI